MYGNATTDHVRYYLQLRYRLLPSIIGAVAQATDSGFPLAARLDLFWPTHAEASGNDQYLFLNDSLVAPVWNTTLNTTSRTVWIPPGEWVDAWNGSRVMGPATRLVSQPYERIPLWHRAGGFVIVSEDQQAQRVMEQDWSHLTIEAFPASCPREFHRTTRHLVERDYATRTQATLLQHPAPLPTESCNSNLSISLGGGVRRAWTLRFHLAVAQQVSCARVDGIPAKFATIPAQGAARFHPLGGRGDGAAPGSGGVAELTLLAAPSARRVLLTLGERAAPPC